MASSEQVRRLVETHSRGDERGFRRAVSAAAAEARDGKKDKLADELEALAAPRRSEPLPLTFSSLRPLPSTEDDLPLLSIHKPAVSLDELVLNSKLSSLLNEIVAEHQKRERLSAFGLWPRSRLLFVGPSGTGKSKTAEGIATALGTPVAKVRLAAVVSSYLGETSRHLEQIFNFASESQMVLVFDEVDMLGEERASSDHGELRRVVAVFLQALEEYRTDSIVIATSNHANALDDALWRRFDEVGVFSPPTQDQTRKLLALKLRRMKSRVNRETVAQHLKGFTQADVEIVCVAAMRNAVMSGRTSVQTDDLLESAHARRARLKEAGRSLS